MKKFLFCLAALTPLITQAQTDSFTINGQIGKIGIPAKVYLAYKTGNDQMLDSAYVNGGSFTFKGTIQHPVSAKLLLDHTGTTFTAIRMSTDKTEAEKKADILTFYLDKGTMTIAGADSVIKAQISGSPINDDNSRLNAKLSAVTARAKRIKDYASTLSIAAEHSPEYTAALQARLKPLQAEREGILQAFIKSNPTSYVSLNALELLGGPSADPVVMGSLYESLSAELKATEHGKQLATYINELKVTAVGAMAPDFTQNDAAGKPIALSSFRGRYVLLDFWASWCKPYRAESPGMVRVFNKYKAKKFVILGVSLDEHDQKNAWTSAVEHDGLTWPQVSDLKGWQNAAAGLYFVHAIPQNYLIGPDGKIIAKNLRGAELENKLAEIFGKI